MEASGYLECEKRRTAFLLMACGGLLGGFTYTIRGGVFCNAQTGNIVLLGFALGSGDWSRAAYLLLPISAYMAGAVISEILPNRVKRRSLGLRWDTLLVGFEMLVTFLLGLLPETAPYQITQVAVNFICSMQYNTFRQVEGVPMATTFCTNHLRQLGVHLERWLRHRDKNHRSRFLLHLEMLAIFVAGAAAGTLLSSSVFGKAIWCASLLFLLVFLDLLHADLFTERAFRDRKPGGHDTTSFKEKNPLSLERKDA